MLQFEFFSSLNLPRPVLGGKVLGVSNTQFTIRESGDNAIEEGNVWGLGNFRLVSTASLGKL